MAGTDADRRRTAVNARAVHAGDRDRPGPERLQAGTRPFAGRLPGLRKR